MKIEDTTEDDFHQRTAQAGATTIKRKLHQVFGSAKYMSPNWGRFQNKDDEMVDIAEEIECLLWVIPTAKPINSIPRTIPWDEIHDPFEPY